MQFSVQSDIDKAIKQLGALGRQVPFASSVAINNTLKDIQQAEQEAARRELDEPTPSTVKGIRMSRSSKHHLVGSVFIIPHIDKFLKYQIEGGTRAPRSKAEAVPVDIRLNKYGNIPGRRQGKLSKLLSRPDTFSATIKGVPGIWQRGNGRNRGRIMLLVAYEKQTRYQPKFYFYRHAQRTVKARWARNFNKAISIAIRTAR